MGRVATDFLLPNRLHDSLLAAAQVPYVEGGADWQNQKNVDSRPGCGVADVRSTQQTEASRR